MILHHLLLIITIISKDLSITYKGMPPCSITDDILKVTDPDTTFFVAGFSATVLLNILKRFLLTCSARSIDPVAMTLRKPLLFSCCQMNGIHFILMVIKSM